MDQMQAACRAGSRRSGAWKACVTGAEGCHGLRHCERSDLSAEALAKAEAIQNPSAEAVWILLRRIRAKLLRNFVAALLAMTAETANAPYDSRMSSSLRPSPFSSFFTALEATTSPSLA